MKKSILAIAVGAALAAAGAAQAEVTIFGKAHLSFDMITAVDPEDATKTTSNMYVSSNSTQLGFKEEEEIAEGLKAGLFFDTLINADSKDTNGGTGTACASTTTTTSSTGTTPATPYVNKVTCDKDTYVKSTGVFDRQTYAYLSGGFGTFTIGKVEGLNKLLGRKIDFFGDQIGDSRNLIKAGANDERPAGVVQYTSPKLGPVGVQAMFKPNEGAATKSSKGSFTDENTLLGLGVSYADGPVFVGFTYETIGAGLNGHLVTIAPAVDDKKESSTNMRLGATFTMGDATVGGLFSSVSNVGGADGTDNTAYGIGASYKIGQGAVKGQYYMTDTDCTGCKDLGASMFALGYDHNLSKKTKVYAAYAATSNDKMVAYSAVGAGHGSGQSTGTIAGEGSSGLSFGIVHSM